MQTESSQRSILTSLPKNNTGSRLLEALGSMYQIAHAIPRAKERSFSQILTSRKVKNKKTKHSSQNGCKSFKNKKFNQPAIWPSTHLQL